MRPLAIVACLAFSCARPSPPPAATAPTTAHFDPDAFATLCAVLRGYAPRSPHWAVHGCPPDPAPVPAAARPCRVVWSSAPDGRTDLRYDDDGRLVEARNILYTWRYRYDADGRLVGGEPPDPSWTLTRDGERLAAMSDGRFTRTFTWDDQGRLIRVDTAQAAGDLVTTFEWSGGRLTALTDGDGRTVVAYDCAARAT